MALSRVKTWTAEELTSADLNAEFDNILSNATSLISPLTGNLAFGGYRATGLSAGSVGNPSLQPTGDTDTGIYFGTDSILFACGGVNQASFAKVGVAGSEVYGLALNPTLVEAASGTHAILSGLRISTPTITTGAATVTNAATVYIESATGATVTGSDYTLWVDDGTTQLDGDVNVGGALDVVGALTGLTGAFTSILDVDGAATLDAGATISSTAVDTIPLILNHNPSGTITSRIAEFREKDTARFSFVADEQSDGAPLELDSFDNSTGLGRAILVGRNSNASTPAPGHMIFRDKSNTARYLWFDSVGDPRYDTSAPTNTDTGGTNLAAATVLGGASTAANQTTMYHNVFGGLTNVTEANVEVIMPRAGTLRNLYVDMNAVLDGSESVVVTVRKNAGDTTLTCTVTQPAQTANDTTHTVAVVAGDAVCIKALYNGDVASTPNVFFQFGLELIR